MPLTPDEEKKLREQIRRDLEDRERRIKASKTKVEQSRQAKIEERLRERIKDEEEEQYYTERGLVRYQNRYGEVEWISPEESEKRQSRRRTKRTSSRRKAHQRRKVFQWVLTGIGAVAALALYMFLLKYNPNRTVDQGSLVITSDVPGAQIYVNGSEKAMYTPDTLGSLPAGKSVFVTVYKDGYTTWPPMQRIDITKGQFSPATFELKNSARMAKIQVSANVRNFDFYVDGIPYDVSDPTIEIPAGFHVISAVKKGYVALPAYHRIVIEESGVTPINFQFEESKEVGYLEVASNVTSAYVYLDEDLTGIKANSHQMAVPAGIYKIRVRENGYKSDPSAQLVTINPGEVTALRFHLDPIAARDTLQIATRLPGATLLVDGKWIPHVTPVPDLELSPGGHFINFYRNGRLYAESDMYVDLAQEEEKVIQIDF